MCLAACLAAGAVCHGGGAGIEEGEEEAEGIQSIRAVGVATSSVQC